MAQNQYNNNNNNITTKITKMRKRNKSPFENRILVSNFKKFIPNQEELHAQKSKKQSCCGNCEN